MEPTLQRHVIEATFHPDRIGNPDPESFPLFTFEGNIDPSTREIRVKEGIGMIIFNLKTEQIGTPPLPEAVFQSEPIQWFDSIGNPVLKPDIFMFQRIGDKTVTLIDFNSNQSHESIDKNHGFNLVVAYKGNTYGSDPTIINLPPDPGI